VRARLALLVLVSAPLLSACALLSPPDALRDEALPSARVAAGPGPLEAGAAKVDITPRGSVYMGGFGLLRASEGVHDPLSVRALALRRGGVTALVLTADLIGLHHHHVEAVRDRLARLVPRAAVLVHATHDHDGPDTLGMWGLPPLVSGIDEDYLGSVLDALVRAGEEAVAALGPATLRVGQVQAPAEGISRNRRDPEVIDRTVTALALDRPDGTPVATVVHFACHPETLGGANRLLSADFPGPLEATVEAARPGSVALFLNGPLGGMVTVDQRGHTFDEAARIGTALGRLALGALDDRPVQEEVALAASSRPVWMPVQNRRFHLGDLTGLFDGRPFDGGYTETEVQALRLGPVVLLTAPGEVLPKLGFQLQALVAAPVPLVVSLGDDELGYLIPEDDWAAARYHYERTVSVGPLAPVLLRRTARAALGDLGALRPGP
jgi:hypothetical protein